jgi:hypothetical protein
MFEETRKKIGVSLAKFHYRKQEYQPVKFSRFFSNARSAVVILPVERSARSMAIPFLRSLQNKFRGNKLTLVSYDNSKDLSGQLGQCTVFPLREEAISIFDLPKKQAIGSLFKQKFDVAFDLNIPLVVSAAYICRGIDAPLKVGFSKENADLFYNFQFTTAPHKNPQARYAQLLRTLDMF